MKMNFKSTIGTFTNTMNKHLPELLAGTGVSLLIASGVNAVLVTPKATKELEKKKDILKKEKLTTKETIRTAGKYYAMPIIGAGLGTACVVASVTTSNKRYLALSSVYNFTSDSYNILKEKMLETVDEATAKTIQDKVADAKMEKAKPIDNSNKSIMIMDKNDVLCYDSYSGRYFKSTMEKLKAAENMVNSEIIHNNYASYNFFGNEVGLEYIDLGFDIGWNIDNVPQATLFRLDMSSKLTPNGVPCIVIDYNVLPTQKYDIFG